MTSYTRARHIAIPEKSVFRLVSRLIVMWESVNENPVSRDLDHALRLDHAEGTSNTTTPARRKRSTNSTQLARFVA